MKRTVARHPDSTPTAGRGRHAAGPRLTSPITTPAIRARVKQTVSAQEGRPAIAAGTLGTAKLLFPSSGMAVFVDDRGRRALVSVSVLHAVIAPRRSRR